MVISGLALDRLCDGAGRSEERHHVRSTVTLAVRRVLAVMMCLLLDEGREAVSRRGSCRTGAARDQHVGADAAENAGDQPRRLRARSSLYLTSWLRVSLSFWNLRMVSANAIDGAKRRRGEKKKKNTYPRANVRQRRRQTDGELSSNAACRPAHNALTNVFRWDVVAEADIGELHLAADFDVC